jgi:hypothetical protein
MARKNIYETEEVARGIARTQSDMDRVLRNPSVRNEVSAVEARYAALAILEDFMKSAAGGRKLSAYRNDYHRDFIVTVSLNDSDSDSVSYSSRELAFA